MPSPRVWRHFLTLCLLVAALQQLAGAGIIQTKAWLAQHLILQAWEQSLLVGNDLHRPWPWVDTWPVARLTLSELAVDQIVLAGTSGNALAFGPGLELAAAKPGHRGTTLIAGHRDTHFEFLRHVAIGMVVTLQNVDGQMLNYQVVKIDVVDTTVYPHPQFTSDVQALQLVTCYPFDAAAPNGPLRYVVTAIPQLGFKASHLPPTNLPSQGVFAL